MCTGFVARSHSRGCTKLTRLATAFYCYCHWSVDWLNSCWHGSNTTWYILINSSRPTRVVIYTIAGLLPVRYVIWIIHYLRQLFLIFARKLDHIYFMVRKLIKSVFFCQGYIDWEGNLFLFFSTSFASANGNSNSVNDNISKLVKKGNKNYLKN